MSSFDYKKFVKNLNDHELLLIIVEEFKSTQLIALLMTKKTKHKEIYRKIIGKKPPSESATLHSELNEKLANLCLEDLLKLICSTIPIKSLMNELLKLDKKSQNRIMYNKIDDTLNMLFKKIVELSERICEFPNQFNEINELGELIELIDLTIESEGETDELKQSKRELTEKIENNVTKVINEYYGNRFQISDNGIDYRRELPKINIHNVHAHTVVFDFYADRKENVIKFKDLELPQGYHFFLIWLNNIVGFPESERFIYLNGKVEEDIIDVKPFMNQLYTFEIYDYNENQLMGVMNNEGDVIEEPRYTEFMQLSKNYFKGYRVNPDEKTNDIGDIIDEKWILFSHVGKISEFKCKNIISVDEVTKIVLVLNNENHEVEISLK